ncbi:IS1380 family transposase [Hahella sp. KA22]|uniref:IS1380 family transposase n=1 Tax=Hahella sp. KA22 TaxID=1628392 RepID=UPI000FDE985A|nr:IS1380 family transposase [Hahella sp. KA22]AZZ90654.1 IS1380 family transposase [Hahella sp. KA22]QAY54025.1 IS1380 family transposase [Hahella sp. KA22]
MSRIHLRSSHKTLTSHAGLALIGDCLSLSHIDALDGRFPTSRGMKTSDLIKCYVGLLCLGQSDFEAITNRRADPAFRKLLKVGKVPSSEWLRQRLEQLAEKGLSEHLPGSSVELLKGAEALVSLESGAAAGYVCLDIDTFVMDNSDTRKEGVSRTYQQVDGYTPIAAYLGNEGWCLDLELRPGKQHSVKDSDGFMRRVLPRAKRLTTEPLLIRQDSGFCSQEYLWALRQQREQAWEEQRRLDYIVKWNPRSEARDMALWVQLAEGRWREVREGKREALWLEHVECRHGGNSWEERRVIRLVERTSDRQGQLLLEPEYELEGWWSTLEQTPEQIIKSYRAHATHEQFHSEIKSDLDLERLPSGKFAVNDLVLRLAMLAYNCLRLLGQLGMTGTLSPVRHPAKRRRLKTVLQEFMYRAAQLIHSARRWILDFGEGFRGLEAFMMVQAHLRRAASG